MAFALDIFCSDLPLKISIYILGLLHRSRIEASGFRDSLESTRFTHRRQSYVDEVYRQDKDENTHIQCQSNEYVGLIKFVEVVYVSSYEAALWSSIPLSPVAR